MARLCASLVRAPANVSCLAVMLLLCILSEAYAGLLGGGKQAPGEQHGGESLFDQSLSWSDDELAHKARMYSAVVGSREEFLAADNLAEYIGLSRVNAVHMPVPLNFVFVGFEGDGNLDISYTVEELQVWFGQLDHVLPHARIELAELDCSETGYCAGMVHGHYHQRPLPSYVHLNFSCQVVAIKRRSVVAAFERAIHVFSRPVTPASHQGEHQVDMTKFEAFVDHFVDSLGLQYQYTQVVLNPTWSSSQPMYGYRQGLSEGEIQLIKSVGRDQLLSTLTELSTGNDEPRLPAALQKPQWKNGQWTLFASQPADSKFSINDATAVSEAWVSLVEPYLKREEDYRTALLRKIDQGSSSTAILQAARVIKRMKSPLSDVLREELFGNPDSLLSRFRTAHPAEDCLVGNWVGLKRWLLLDLTAAAGDWGPAAGGEGVVTRATVPRVQDFFGALVQRQRDMRLSERLGDEAEMSLQKELMQTKSQMMASTSNAEYQAFSLKRQAWELEASAPGAPPMDIKKQMEAWGIKYKEALARAELDTYEQFALKHCHNAANPVPLCQDMKQDVDALRAKLSKIAATGEVTTELFPKHNWDIFGLGSRPMWGGSGSASLDGQGDRMHDYFMAELAALMSRGLRHVISPPTGVWRRAPLVPQAGAAVPSAAASVPARDAVSGVFARKVVFELVHVWELRHDMRAANNPRIGTSFNTHEFKKQVSSLRLTSKDGHSFQTFEFKERHVDLTSEPAVAAAFSVSLHAASHEVQLGPGEQSLDDAAEQLSIDSHELLHHLKGNILRSTPDAAQDAEPAGEEDSLKSTLVTAMMAAAGAEAGAGMLLQESTNMARWRRRQRRQEEAMAKELTIPVVVFNVHRNQPVLIDDHYNARAIGGAVIVVSNTAKDDEHPLGMMCNGALQSRPLSPLKDALSAVLLALGGVLPLQLGYNAGRRQVSHDWLWSVGAHPLSATSTGFEYSQMHRDALGRSYLLDALDVSVETVNRGVELLRAQRPSHRLHAHLKSPKAKRAWKAMLKYHSMTFSLWRQMVGYALELEYGKAADLIKDLRSNSELFYEACQKVATANESMQCIGRTVEPGSRLTMAVLYGSAGLALLAACYAGLPAVSMLRGRNQRRKF
mmetsp:Transcript_32185/g.96098  ORF Transcript_32185/g.96098 Transcript_32185/m.96098 type:complete len:1123 (-) Transcript_32185:516-3884(-)